MFAKRFLVTIVLWSVVLTVLFHLGLVASALLCCLVSTFALWEFYDMLDKSGRQCAKGWGIGGGILLSAGTWWFSARHPGFTSTFEVLLLASLLLGLFLRQLAHCDKGDSVQVIANTLLGILYISWLFSFIAKIQCYYADGLFIFYLVVVTKFCDVGAYTSGRLFGRHKLAPRISPNKTWEGLLGGLVVSLIASIAAFKYLEPRVARVGFQEFDALVLGVLLGLFGVVGDLSESLLKRQTQVKDSGGVLPGIGGALDLIDSLLFSTPILYAYLTLVVQVRGAP